MFHYIRLDRHVCIHPSCQSAFAFTALRLRIFSQVIGCTLDAEWSSAWFSPFMKKGRRGSTQCGQDAVRT